MRSRLGKVGMLMLVLVMAVGAMGAGFAAFTDEMIVQGTVSTATVDYEVTGLSGTWVYKDISNGFSNVAIREHLEWGLNTPPQPPVNPNWMLISSAIPAWDNGTSTLSMAFNNIFPCIDFCADVILHYIGTIPAHISLEDLVWTSGGPLAQYMDVKFYVQSAAGAWVLAAPADIQLHNCNLLKIVFCLHIPQDNLLQGIKDAAFSTKLTMFQWNEADEPCGPVVQQGVPGPDWTKAGGVRVKGYNTGAEIYVGPMQDPSALPRTEVEYNDFMSVALKTYSLVVSYDASEDDLAVSISDPAASATWLGGSWGCAPAGWNAMEILVRDNSASSGAALQNVTLNAIPLGDFGVVDKAGSPGWQNWSVTGFDFSQDFTVMADLVVDGYNASESIKVEFNVGCIA